MILLKIMDLINDLIFVIIFWVIIGNIDNYGVGYYLDGGDEISF